MSEKLSRYRKRINKIQYFKDYDHAAKKLFKYKKQFEARAFSVSCFKYIRNIIFFIGSLLTISFFDIPIIQTETQVALLVVRLLLLFLILTFALYILSLIYFPLCKMIYYLNHRRDKNPYKSTGKMDKDTKKMYNAAAKLHKNASSLWSTWWHALYVKRSRILKIVTALTCGGVTFLRGYFDAECNIHAAFKKLNVFSENMATDDIVSLCLISVGFELVIYFILWLTFYYSDRMILSTQFRHSVVHGNQCFEEKLLEYWREHDEKEKNRYYEELDKWAKEKEEKERRRSNSAIGNSHINGSEESSTGLTDAEAWHAIASGMMSIDTTGM